jgi:hypothetical protein
MEAFSLEKFSIHTLFEMKEKRLKLWIRIAVCLMMIE